MSAHVCGPVCALMSPDAHAHAEAIDRMTDAEFAAWDGSPETQPLPTDADVAYWQTVTPDESR